MNSDMIKIYSASFMLSIILSIFLFIYPLMWKDLGKSTNELSIVYLIVFLPAAIFIYPSIRYLEKIKRIDISTSFGWIFLFISFLSFLFVERNIFSLYLLAIFFFLGSTIFHSTLPSLLSLKVSEKMRANLSSALLYFFKHPGQHKSTSIPYTVTYFRFYFALAV